MLQIDMAVQDGGLRSSIKPDDQSSFGINDMNRDAMRFAFLGFEPTIGRFRFKVGVNATGILDYPFSNSKNKLTATREMRVTIPRHMGGMCFSSELKSMTTFPVGQDLDGYFVDLPTDWFVKQKDNLFAGLDL